MRKIVTLNGPSIEVNAGASGNFAVKRWALLEDWALAWECLPADAEIVHSHIWSQQMVDYPGNCYGDVTWAVYPALYAQLSGVPDQERCQPFGLDLLGRLLLRPGADVLDWRDHLDGIAYGAGQRIGFFFEVAGAPYRQFSLFPAVRVHSATGFTPRAGIVHHDLPNASVVNAGSFSFRSVIPNIRCGGNEVRITAQSLADGLSLSHMSVGVRSSNFNMTALPVPVTFGGHGWLDEPAYRTIQSDWVPLTTLRGDSLLIHSCVGGNWAYKQPGYDFASEFVPGTGGYDAQNFSGTLQPGRIHVVAMVEVR